MIVKIDLKEKYKSFDQNFKTELDGKLIILSGVNGSGKSQLIKIIYGKIDEPTTGNKRALNRIVTLDNIEINWQNIEIRSFKDNISIPEVVKSSSSILNSSAEQAFSHYKNHGLNPILNPNFVSSITKVIKLLGDLYDENSRNIPEGIFKDIIRNNKFIWRQDDVFSDIIGNIFFNHAIEISEGQQNAGMVDGPAFNPLSLGIAPWTELNELFTLLKFEYRFKDNYSISYGELNETPILFQIDSHGNIIEDESRQLNDLSDGEKAIISLCFTSLQKIDVSDKKLLLFDEFDAALNPSLVESFFIVIEKYFINKGIGVVITTHSPATITLAPEYTSYYEMFKKNDSEFRIFKVNRDDYLELQKVNKSFYEKINDQNRRIKELEANIESDENVLIITEGKTDWKYIIKALQYFHHKQEFLEIKESYFYRFGTLEDVQQNICGTNVYADLGEAQLNSLLSNEINFRTGNKDKRKKIQIGVFDSDTDIKNKYKNDYGVFSFKIEPNNISTEFLFDDSEIKTEINGLRLYIGTEFDERTARHKAENITLGVTSSKRAGKREIIDTDVFDENSINKSLSKEKFAQAVFNDEIIISEKSYENFRHIFSKIVECFS